MKIQTKRIYDQVLKSDGFRILVDRLWPRGVKKEDAHIDLWAKELAPSNDLRKWFHDNPEKRFSKFKDGYKKELKTKGSYLSEVIPTEKKVTLVTSVKDIDHSHIPVLLEFVEKHI